MLAALVKSLGSHRDVRLLQMVTLLRSTGQGIALVDTSLFLKELGWSGGAIGLSLAAAGIVRTLLTLFAKELNGYLGAKFYLLVFEALTVFAALIVTVSTNSIALHIAMIAAGLGSGHSGSGGPASPVERSWLAAYARHDSKQLFNINAFLSYVGMGAGCMFACLPSLWNHSLPGSDGYRPVFVIMTMLAAGCVCLILQLNGGKRKMAAQPLEAVSTGKARRVESTSLPLILRCTAAIGLTRKQTAGQEHFSLEEGRYLANLLSSVTATLTCTMTAYWFSTKFEASAGWIGAVMGTSYVAAGLLSLTVAAGADKYRAARSVIVMQLIAIVFMLILPWSASFGWAAVLEIGCTACNLGARGNRTAVMMEDRTAGRRSLRSKVNYTIVRIGAVLWPGAFGQFIEEGHYIAPFYIAAALQSASACLYAKVYRRSLPDNKKTLIRSK